jgi:GNAT superfamily N-acetyltransferase
VLRVEPLSRSHDRERFDCGVSALNEFLRQTARQHQEKGISRTFVLVAEDSADPKAIFGFFTLAASEGIKDDLPPEFAKRFPARIPAVVLARLAVDARQQGKGYGGILIAETLSRIASLSEQLGIAGLFVDAKDVAAAAFYRKFGFSSLISNPLRLFLPLGSIVRLVGK